MVLEGQLRARFRQVESTRECVENIEDREEGRCLEYGQVPPTIRMFAGKKANYAISRQVPSSMMEDTSPARSPTA